MQCFWRTTLLILGLFIFPTAVSQIPNPVPAGDWVRKEVGVVIQMTLEFLKDMDMKMRDVRRIERYYYGTHDFGAGRIFAEIESKFVRMVTLYKNTSYILRIMSDKMDLRTDVVGSLQIMLGDYMEFLSLIELFKERYSYWQANSALSRIKDIVKDYLLKQNQRPYRYSQEAAKWRRSMHLMPAPKETGPILKDEDPDDDFYDYVGFYAWCQLVAEYPYNINVHKKTK